MGTTPVKDRKVYKFDPGRYCKVTLVHMYAQEMIYANLSNRPIKKAVGFLLAGKEVFHLAIGDFAENRQI